MLELMDDLVDDVYYAICTPVPGRKAGDLGSTEADHDDVIAGVKAKLVEQGYSPDHAQEQAEYAVYNYGL